MASHTAAQRILPSSLELSAVAASTQRQSLLASTPRFKPPSSKAIATRPHETVFVQGKRAQIVW